MDTEQFWSWFVENEHTIFDFEDNVETVFNAIAQELVKVDDNVTFELSSINEAGKRQFVFSAAGLSSSFPAVEQFVDTAPTLERWVFVKYRQRMNVLLNVEFGGVEVDPDNIHYVIVKDTDPYKAGVLLFFDGYTEQARDIYGNIGYLILDQALGEYIVETRVGVIGMFDRSSPYFLNAKPVKELAEHFDYVIGQL